MNSQNVRTNVEVIALLGCAVAMAACQLGSAGAAVGTSETQDPPAAAQADSTLVIENDSELPNTYPHGSYEVLFRTRGGTSPLHWRLQKGSLAPGLKLEDNGLLHGQAERTGEFQFTVLVTDSMHQAGVQKEFVLRVLSALTLKWKAPARVNGSRIEGSAEISNATRDDMDLTFVAMAVAENGRATAIGYQHFLLRRGTLAKELPFGETLPHGGYVVHVDAVGEVLPKNLIYRDRLQTPSALQVTVGP
jgi:hypothetical protein